MKDIWQLDTTYSTALLCDGSIDVIHFYPKRMWAGLPSYVFGGHMGDCPSPAAELILKREDYDADYFIWGGCMFVSARMRDAIALDSSEVRYFEVEDSRSAPRARAKNYQIMEPLWCDYIFDEEGSVYWTDSTPPPGEYGPTEIYKLVFLKTQRPGMILSMTASLLQLSCARTSLPCGFLMRVARVCSLSTRVDCVRQMFNAAEL